MPLKWPEITVLAIVREGCADYLRVICGACGDCVEFTAIDQGAQHDDAFAWLNSHVAYEIDPKRDRDITRFTRAALDGAKTQLWGSYNPPGEAV